ncbi:4Fe-4S binding protein, partial [Ferroplasma acidiphilum]
MVTYIIFVFSYILRHKTDISFLRIAAIGIFTAMMASMLDAFLLYITTVHNFLDTGLAFTFGMILMSQPVVAVFVGVMHGGLDRKGLTKANATAFTGLIIWNEVSMGLFLFYLFNPTIIHFDYYHTIYSFDFVSALSNGINTIYFIVPMSIEMFALFLVYKPKGMHKYAAISIFTMDLFAPTLLGNDKFVFIGGVGETAIMIIFMIIFFEFMAKHKLILPKDDAYHIKMIFIDYLLMGIGTFIGTIILKPFGFAWIFFAVAILFGMWYYFSSMFSVKTPSIDVTKTENNVVIKRKKIINKPARLIFFVLVVSFVSELLMAGSMDFATYNYLPFFRAIDTLPSFHGVSVAGFYAHDVLR